jgi:Flp pilus assembly protein CpaB
VAVSAQRRRRALVAVVAALIAAGAFYLAMEYAGKTPTGSPTAAASSAAVPTVSVVVASASIPAGTELSVANLKTQTVAATDLPTVPSGTTAPYYVTVTALTQSKEYAEIAIPAGTVVVSSMVSTSPAAGSAPIAGIPAALPAGYVSVALPYDPSGSGGTGSGTGGFVQAGDRIDVLVYNDSGTLTWAYENVLVLAIGESNGAPAASSGTGSSSAAAGSTGSALVMVELSRQDAAAMTDVEDQSGWLIQYLIVSANDYPSASSSPVPGINAGPTAVSNPSGFFGG